MIFLGFQTPCKIHCLDSILAEKTIIYSQQYSTKTTFKQYHWIDHNYYTKKKRSLKNIKKNQIKISQEALSEQKIKNNLSLSSLELNFDFKIFTKNDFQTVPTKVQYQNKKINQNLGDIEKNPNNLKTKECQSFVNQKKKKSAEQAILSKKQISQISQQQLQIFNKIKKEKKSFTNFGFSLFQVPQIKTQYNTQRQSNEYQSIVLEKYYSFPEKTSTKNLKNNNKKSIQQARLTFSKHFKKSSDLTQQNSFNENNI